MEENKRNYSILVIEDDRDTGELIRTILKKEGYAVTVARDGESGLNEAVINDFDLILLDIMLPGMDGLEVCKMLADNDETRSIPVIILTAKQELSTKLSSFVAGAKRFLSKPFEASELVEEVRRTLRQREIQGVAPSTTLDPRD